MPNPKKQLRGSLTRDNVSSRENIARTLVERLELGDTSALYDLSEYYADELYAIAISITESHDLAQDILQDILVKIWDQRNTLRSSVYDFTGLLRRMVRHRAIDILRHEQSQHRVAERMGEVYTTERPYHLHPGLAKLEADDIRKQVLSVLESVPPRCREIFLMHWEGGMSYAEIADTIGITTGTVRTQMYRAMRALTTHFKQHPL